MASYNYNVQLTDVVADEVMLMFQNQINEICNIITRSYDDQDCMICEANDLTRIKTINSDYKEYRADLRACLSHKKAVLRSLEHQKYYGIEDAASRASKRQRTQ